MRVEITSKNIQKLLLGTRVDDESGDLVVKISVDTKLHPADIARLLNLQKNRAQMFFTIGSQQAELDLQFITVKSEKIETPEPKSDLAECPDCHGLGSRMDEDTRIDVACAKCKGRGKIPQTEVQGTPAVSAAPVGNQEATEPVSAPNLSGGKGKKPKRRQPKTASPATTDSIVSVLPVASCPN